MTGQGRAVRLDDALDPRMAVAVPSTDAAMAEAEAIGVTQGAVVERAHASTTYLLSFDTRVAAACLASDTGIVAMTTGTLRVEEPQEPDMVQAQLIAAVPINDGMFKAIETLTEDERASLVRKVKKHERREEVLQRMEAEIMQRFRRNREPLRAADDVEIARRTITAIGADIGGVFHRAVWANGFFWRYDAAYGVWQKISQTDMSRILTSMWWQHPRLSREGTTPLTLSTNKVNSVMRMLTILSDDPAFFTSVDTSGIGMRNGFLTILRGRIHIVESSPMWRCNSYIDADFNEQADCPLWRKYVDDVMEPVGVDASDLEAAKADAQKKKDLLQEFVGACLMGYAWRYQKCLVLYGTGGNGKSVFTNVVSRLFDENSVCSVPPHDWTDKFRPQIMVGARVNLVSELPERDIADGERFKAVTVGDPITVERKYGDPVTAPITAGHIFSCNALPHANDTSDGFWRRFLVVIFSRSFHGTASQDVDLDRRIIETEIPGIARWALEGAIRLQRNGKYTQPGESELKLAEWRESSDPLKSFLGAAITIADTAPSGTLSGVSASDFYRVYQQWCRDNGHTPLSSTKFGVKMKSHVKMRRTRSGLVYEANISSAYRHVLRQAGT